LWCGFEAENNLLTVDGPHDTLFDEPIPSTTGVDVGETSTVSSEVTNANECCICYENIDALKNNCTTECGHKFCFKCLATSMVHNNFSCPCCRTQLVESSEDSDEEEEDEEDEEEEGEEEEEEGDDNEVECEVEELSRRLEVGGFKMHDILAMLLGRYVKGSSDLAIYEMNKKFDALIDEADGEAIENDAMGQEDFRVREVIA
jgi:hypothetical protein